MPDDYYRQAPVEAAVVAVLNTNLGTQFTAVTAGASTYTAGQCVVECLRPAPRSSSMFGGHDHARVDVTITSIGANRTNAKDAGSKVRQILTERTVNGKYVNTIMWVTGRSDEVVSDTAYLDTAQGINSWVESFSVFYQAHNP